MDDQDYDDHTNSEGLRVLACSISASPDTPAFLAMLDGGGQVSDYLRLKYLLNRRNTTRAKEREDKVRHWLDLVHGCHIFIQFLICQKSFPCLFLFDINFFTTGKRHADTEAVYTQEASSSGGRFR